ncbi:MAG: excalibur calcium-binding domain-containing protein [Chitinispirillaceae bacterium]|nr:excalibur calcium-binding domain-containing protein [Chitinispirillaceae bacterium]
MQNVFIVIIIAAIVLLTNNFLSEKRASEQQSTPSEQKTVKAVTPTAPKYRCDGRIHCSQMTSCEEAKFFLRNCPGVKMDGDHDGIHCEEQCGH